MKLAKDTVTTIYISALKCGGRYKLWKGRVMFVFPDGYEQQSVVNGYINQYVLEVANG
jgi:hypothetical protein